MLWLLIFLLTSIPLWYWYEGRWDARLFKAEPGKRCQNMRARQVRAFLEEHPETQVIDVRSSREFDRGAIDRAQLVPLSAPDFLEQISHLDRALPVLVYCAGGYRGRKAIELMKPLGFAHLVHLHRGYLSWQALRSPINGRDKNK